MESFQKQMNIKHSPFWDRIKWESLPGVFLFVIGVYAFFETKEICSLVIGIGYFALWMYRVITQDKYYLLNVIFESDIVKFEGVKVKESFKISCKKDFIDLRLVPIFRKSKYAYRLNFIDKNGNILFFQYLTGNFRKEQAKLIMSFREWKKEPFLGEDEVFVKK